MEKDIKTQRLYHALAEYIRRCNERGRSGEGRQMKENKETETEEKETSRGGRADELSLGAILSEKEKSFPNICGFCRFIGRGTRELMESLSGDKQTADRILTIFEDEAFRSGISSAVMTQYLKLLEELREQNRGVLADDGFSQISVFFPHQP